MAHQNKQSQFQQPNPRTTIISVILFMIVAFFVGQQFMAMSSAGTTQTDRLITSEFVQAVEQDRVTKVVYSAGDYTVSGSYYPAITAGSAASDAFNDAFQALNARMATVKNPDTGKALAGVSTTSVDAQTLSEPRNYTSTYYGGSISDLMASHPNIPYEVQLPSPFLDIISTLLPIALIALVLFFFFSQMQKANNSQMSFGKAKAKKNIEERPDVKFSDVAGVDEAVEEMQEIKDFLANPAKYQSMGAKIPRGCLLVGPPGTGKTLLAKAVAGEAGVPFFSISGSDFVEMFVGMGAARVRDLFKEANKMAPCIVFIDEIDTIGKSRDNRMGGNDEREQTLNQLLAEMDGFDPTKGVILLAATNRPEVLDQALLRPGRFDRRIIVDRPNLAGRLATLQVHTRNIRLAEDVNLRKIAIATAGTVGADLANLVNEAALRAVRLGRKAVNQEDLLAAFELVIAGAEKKGSVLSEFEKKLVAYHEVGHAMVAYRQKHAEPVSKITIVPHTQGALGYTLHLPEEDKHLHTRDELLAQITVSMGGRVAEELVLHTMTNGAAQDIQDATGIARNMVAMFGMSDEFGMMALASRRSQYLDGGYGIDCAQDTAAAMDRAVRDLIDACYKKAVEILSHSREDMDKVVEYLLEKETITGAEMVAILEGRDPALADNFPDPDGKGTAGPPAEPVSAPIPLSGGEPQPPDGGGMEFGPEGKPKE